MVETILSAVTGVKKVFDATIGFIIFLAIVGGTILFAPSVFIQAAHLTNIQHEYGYVFGIIFWFALAALMAKIFASIWDFAKAVGESKIAVKIHVTKGLKWLKDKADLEDWAMLINIYDGDNHSRELGVENGSLLRLIEHGVITPTSNRMWIYDKFYQMYTVQEYAFAYIAQVRDDKVAEINAQYQPDKTEE
jgi:hypothetical protein